MSEQLSIIVPVHNESKHILHFLKHLQIQASLEHEIIVVDGESTDGTVSLIKSQKEITVIQAKKRRAIQLNEGANCAKNEWLFFVHADTILPYHFDRLLLKNLKSKKTARCFSLNFDLDHFSLKIAALGSRLNIAWCRGGDQTLMIHKELFNDIEGFDEQYNIAEDLLLCRKIYRHGNFEILSKSVITSGRKFFQNGVFKTQLRHIVVRIMIFSGLNYKKLNAYSKKW